MKTYDLDPLRYIGEYAGADEIAGGDPAENAKILRSVLAGDKGARRDITCLNAAAAIVAGGKAGTMDEGWEQAAASIDEGRAAKALEGLIEGTAPSSS